MAKALLVLRLEVFVVGKDFVCVLRLRFFRGFLSCCCCCCCCCLRHGGNDADADANIVVVVVVVDVVTMLMRILNAVKETGCCGKSLLIVFLNCARGISPALNK